MKDRAKAAGLTVAKNNSGDFGVKNNASELSLKTATPGKVIPTAKKSADDHTMANSIMTYDTKTTKGKNKMVIDDDSSIDSLQSIHSMNREQLLAYRKESEQKAKEKAAEKICSTAQLEKNVSVNASAAKATSALSPSGAPQEPLRIPVEAPKVFMSEGMGETASSSADPPSDRFLFTAGRDSSTEHEPPTRPSEDELQEPPALNRLETEE